MKNASQNAYFLHFVWEIRPCVMNAIALLTLAIYAWPHEKEEGGGYEIIIFTDTVPSGLYLAFQVLTYSCAIVIP